MNNLKYLTIALLFLLTIGSGIYLSRIGRPLNPVLFNIHKLIALAAVVYTVIVVYGLMKEININVLIVVLISISVLSVIALFTTGALLSTGEESNNLLLITHNITTFLIVISTILVLYSIVKRINYNSIVD
ncbi:MAG: hypothetical protein ACOC2J_03955 [bacterium]